VTELAPVVWGTGETFFFLLANGIIIAICLPPLLKDIQRWRS
jgi:hypothetical protein